MGRRAFAAECHVGRIEQLEPLVEQVVGELGRLDILVNNAGTSFTSTAMDMTEKAWDTIMNLNVKGLFFLSQAAARQMRDQGDGGSIINISSIAGFKPQQGTAHYSISKGALHMTTKVMAAEWAPFEIRVNCIAPGAVETKLYAATFEPLPDAEAAREVTRKQIPLQRVGEPEEIAMGVLYLASSASSYMTGQTFAIDGGFLLV